MSGKRFGCIVLLLHVWVGAVAVWGDFGRYQVILDRRPFGDAPAQEVAVAPTRPSGPMLVDALRLVAMTIRQGDIRVGLVDGNVQPPRTYFLFVGEEESGIRVVSADYDAETAVVEREGQQRTFRLGGGSGSRAATTAGPGMIAGVAPESGANRDRGRVRPRGRISEGRRQRMEEEQRRLEQVPELTGAVLERHLQEYNLQVIREGMPPLPIPLTPEQDAQLVAEGVLPPLEE
ncbi:MAG: hypothetical protein ACNA71_07320 [Kiritimatiellia bacterium]